MLKAPTEGLSLDMDSTSFNREGSQEEAAKGYNSRRPRRKSHHPLLAEAPSSPMPGCAVAIDSPAFLAEALALLPEGWRIRCVGADSGFFDHALLGFLEERGLPYIIVARLPQQVKRRLQGAAMV